METNLIETVQDVVSLFDARSMGIKEWNVETRQVGPWGGGTRAENGALMDETGESNRRVECVVYRREHWPIDAMLFLE